MRLRPGTRIAGRYEVVGEQGEAPAVLAYHALDHEVEVEVLLWTVRPELLLDEPARARFVDSALRARALTHPVLRKIFAAGVHEGLAYVALQPITRRTLATRLAAGERLDADGVRHLGTTLADALGAAHAGGLVHGFMAPEDVALAGDEPKLAGLGLWTGLDPAAARLAFAAGGRPLAPELLLGRPPTPATDVWGLALLLGEAALGAPVGQVGGVLALRARLEREVPALAPGILAGLGDEPGLRPDDPLLLMHKLGGIDDLAVPTMRVAARAQTSDPTTNFVKIEPETTGPVERAAPPPLPLAAPEPSGPALAARRTPAPMTTPPPVGSTPRMATPTATTRPVAPRAPTHRTAEQTLPAVPVARPPVRSGRRWFAAVAIVGSIAAGAGVAVLRGGSGRGQGRATPPAPAPVAAIATIDAAPPPDAPATDAAVAPPATGPCPKDMTLVEGRTPVCIDIHEAPGAGVMPTINVSLADARRACTDHGKRLCTGREWERACRGSSGASYPYGDSYTPELCNVRGEHATLALTGAFKACVSAAGAYDMSGNAGEWVEEAHVRGGSATGDGDGRCSRGEKRTSGAASPDVGYRCCVEPGIY